MASQPPNMPPRCAKCATPAAVPVTPNTSSSAPKRITKTRACIGIGGEISKTKRRGEKKPKGGSRDRENGGEGKRGDLGGRRIIKKKKKAPPCLPGERDVPEAAEADDRGGSGKRCWG